MYWCVSYEEEDTYLCDLSCCIGVSKILYTVTLSTYLCDLSAYEKEDTCMSYEEEDFVCFFFD
jgi:hypothetical protein